MLLVGRHGGCMCAAMRWQFTWAYNDVIEYEWCGIPHAARREVWSAPATIVWWHLFTCDRERTTNFMVALITLVVGLLVVVAVLSALAQHFHIPAAILL